MAYLVRESLELPLHTDSFQEPEEGLARGVLQLTQGGDEEGEGLGEGGREGGREGGKEPSEIMIPRPRRRGMCALTHRQKKERRERGREGGTMRTYVPHSHTPRGSCPGRPPPGG
jgi:hypothetical protein